MPVLSMLTAQQKRQVALSAVAVTDEMLATLKRLPIGYTKADSPTFIIDEDGNKLPNGEQGEIIVSGPAVSKGYMNNPEKRQKPL